MFRKVNLRVLLFIFGTLLAIAILSQVLEKKKGERTFKNELAAFDTAKVTDVIIKDMRNGNKGLELVKAGNNWKMKANGKEYHTDPDYIGSLLQELIQMKAERIAANSKEKWKEFEVTDSLALRVTVKGKTKILADLMVGKFSWQPPTNPYDRQGKMTSYIRIADEKEIYAVNGFIRMNLSPDINRFRDKTVIRAETGNLRKLVFEYPADSSFVLEKKDNLWIINGIPADSAKTSQYINSLENMSGDDFADNETIKGPAIYKLTLENNSTPPIEILAYVADSLNGHIITSSLYADTQFSGKSGLTSRIFKGKSSFTK
jgi:hypothetical protein